MIRFIFSGFVFVGAYIMLHPFLRWIYSFGLDLPGIEIQHSLAVMVLSIIVSLMAFMKMD